MVHAAQGVIPDCRGASRRAEGQHWVYFRSPWGTQLELVSYPDGKVYESTASRLLWHPGHPEM